MFVVINEKILEIKRKLEELKSNMDSIGENSQISNIKQKNGYLECLVEELDAYNKLMTERYENTCEVNLLNAIRSFVKASNQNQLKDNRPRVYVKTKDENDQETTFDLEKNKNSEFLSNYFTINHCLPIMQLVPTLLIDNAFKYCNPGGEITISVKKESLITTFTFENLGPKLLADELGSICECDKRGSNALKTCIEGQGLGLYLFKIIMNMHEYLGAHYTITSDADKIQNINNVDYSSFKITFSLLNANNSSETEVNITKELGKKIYECVIHQYLRIMPRICKLSKELFDSLRNDGMLCRNAYEIKKQIFGILSYLQSKNNDFYEFSEKIPSSQKSFQRDLTDEIDFVKKVYNKNFEYGYNKCDKNVMNMHTNSPYIDVFIQEFVYWLVVESGINDVDFIMGNQYLDIAADDPYRLKEEQINIWRENLKINSMKFELSNNNKNITLSYE